MKQSISTLAGLAGMMMTMSASAAPAPVFDYQNTAAGNQIGGPYILGLSFTVKSAVTVNALGAFDSAGLGFSSGNSVQVGIYQYSATPAFDKVAQLTLVSPIVTFNSSSGTLPNQSGSEWSSITPQTLLPGSYAVVAANYTANTPAGNWDYNTGGTSTSPIGFNNYNSALSLVPWGIWTRGTGLSGSYNITWDDSGNNGWGFDPAAGGAYGPHPQPTYAAGSFSVVPEPTGVASAALLLLLPLGASAARVLRKNRAA